jgi:hypothetical protein
MLHLKPHPPTVIIIDGVEWWVFNTKHYENMGENFQDILKTIRQQKAVINYYQDCTN